MKRTFERPCPSSKKDLADSLIIFLKFFSFLKVSVEQSSPSAV